MTDLKINDLVWLPTYEELLEKFGTKLSRVGKEILNINPEWDNNGKMIKMCGDYYEITDISENVVVLNEKMTDINFSFARNIFDQKKKKEHRNKAININNILFRQMAHRYDFIEYKYLKSSQKGFGIIDSIYPNELWKKESNLLASPLRTGAIAISEKVSKDLGVPQLHISDLVSFFGYNKTNISKILLNVKKKNFDILVLGWGGTGTNFTHWMSKMAEWTNIHHIFDRMIVADNDFFDSTNLLRVPFILPEKASKILRKVMYFTDYTKIAKTSMRSHDFVNEKNLQSDYIHYGAPNLETRKMLHEKKVPFIAATHRDNACALMLRPEMDTDLMVETYGKIALTPFFMNHIRMTIAFLEYLGHEDTTFESMQGEEKSIFNFDFAEIHKDEIENGTRISGRTVYPVIADATNTIEINVGE